MADMASKYGARRFDENDANDRCAERVRQAVLAAYREALSPEDDEAPQQTEYVLGGLMVGIVQIMQASLEKSGDQADAAIRASILQLTPWAVDMARSFEGKAPLSDN
ncbi:hypothetical protein AADZ90_021230 [Aestuariibius sp. 2305UL40-4]|uniref:hypothetical protein n=1 Tax=Aestuariibius violaceus TaxID=3234132 RepID=UPI00345E651D